MARARQSAFERRQAELAGGVVLRVLRFVPDSASAEMLRELIDMVLVDPRDRALFDFLGDEQPDGVAALVTGPRSLVLSAGKAVIIR